MRNALTVDLEEHYHATAFSAGAASRDNAGHASRVEQNTERTLEILASKGCLATFFTVGAVAERFPGLIQRIARAGHELACHSYAHRQVFTLSREEFYEDTRRAKSAIEDASGCRVAGYRAPSFSITKDTGWAFDVLAELGFSYDSSIFPVRHLSFEMQDTPRNPFVINTTAGPVVEFPMSTVQIFGWRAPLAGGAYLRLLPYWQTRRGISYLNRSEGNPACVYIHPWELDPEQPRMKGSFSAHLRHYFGLQGAHAKLKRLLEDFEFQPLGLFVEQFRRELAEAGKAVPQLEAAELCSRGFKPKADRG